MELTSEAFIIGLVISGILTSVLTPLLLEQYTLRRVMKKVPQLDRVMNFLSEPDNTETIEGVLDSLDHIGVLAKNANTILNDEEAFDAILTEIAKRAFHVAKMSMMGTASGDVKKLARAERIVNEAMIKGVQEFSPALKILFKMTGLDEELNADPELLPLIMQVVGQNDGLMVMLSGMMGGGANATMLQGTTEQEAIVRDKLGIDF